MVSTKRADIYIRFLAQCLAQSGVFKNSLLSPSLPPSHQGQNETRNCSLISLLMCICPYSKLKYRVRISGEESRSLWRVCHSLLGLQCCLSLSWAAGAYARNQAWLSSDSMPERTSAIVGIRDRLQESHVILKGFSRPACPEVPQQVSLRP